MYIDKNKSYFTQREIAAALQIWNRAAVSLLDIRHNLISPEEALHGYRLPASAFLYTSGGKAEVLLNDTAYNAERFGLFHGGKGTELSIQPRCDWLEYYMVLYKAVEPSTHKKAYANLLEVTNPFRQQYGFMPDNPVFLSELLRKMHEKWIGPTPLNLFYGKTAFYQLVYEIYEELDKGHIPVFQPDIVAMVQRFMDDSYAQNISIQEVANVFSVSYSHLHRIFSRKVGKSPQEYLMETRLNACKSHLAKGKLSMREIAKGTGFSDEYHFNRMFVRHVGITPGEYRKKMTMDMRDSAIGNLVPFPYNEESQVSLGELKGKGATYMLKEIRSKAVAAAALSLMLLMSACSTAPANTGGVDSAPTSAVASQISETEQGTRIVHTVMGDVAVPVKPESIASFGMPGDLVAIGVIPVCGDSEARLFDGLLSSDQYVYTAMKDYEAIMECEPDLIILANAPEKEIYDKLSAIAPTVVVNSNSLSTRERIEFTGDLVGQTVAAKDAMNQFEKKAEACRKKLEDAGIRGKTVTVMEGNYLFGDKYGRGADIVYNYLGLSAPEKLQAVFSSGKLAFEVSMEVMEQYCGDYIIRSVWDGSENLDENAVWNSIPAVKQGYVIEVDFTDYFARDLYTSTKQLEDLTQAFLALK
ncbi:AraC family transcriptional regulator [Clostridium minihomine]|uniref:AraC family transcriptional regulator n=1 Tax=Clostridium minihomine TaxID=2045012 RepID=UPI000C77D109|nr:AraC family transcriptional regulator [Clostridium minihomine]